MRLYVSMLSPNPRLMAALCDRTKEETLTGAYPNPYKAIITSMDVNVGWISRNGSGPMKMKTTIIEMWPISVTKVGKENLSQT